MASQEIKLHAIVIPLMSQSHLIPMIDLSKLLAQRGLTVSIITTPLNALHYQPILKSPINSNLQIHLIPLHFPCNDVGLPQNCENLDSLPCPKLKTKFLQSSYLLQNPLEDYLVKVNPSPSFIISSLPWTHHVAQKFNIPRFAYQGVSCFTLFCSHKMMVHKVYESVKSDFEPFYVPEILDKVEFTYAQLPKMMKKNCSIDDCDGLKQIQDQFKEAESSAEGLLVNSFEELELDYVKSYKNVMRNVLCVGPLSISSKMKNEGNFEGHYCLKWLDLMKPKSVLYVCFGSLCHLMPKQLIELGMGLESSNCPFIWVIRDVDYNEDVMKWLKDENFESRVQGRGLIVKGWAPQVLILSHSATGGFLTHCGWNSTLEAICAGVPMITWPMFAEQFFNEKFIVQVLKIGVRIGVEVSMQWGEEKNDGVYVTRECVKNAIEKLMDGWEIGQERRRRAIEYGEKAKRAIEEGGSSYLNITSFIKHVQATNANK
ncbi:UDP-glycosyltransferase 73C3-like [Amaranthus tricolor]|uniref:UDP-glycosyltransferase 73C3-like n=1 Tax=Amaranthus tricolor TaxID=29722 RepID=UPI00258B231C|nr:UDP-glycosyltransferase 73C3-like [Amaranthus tricolor]